MKGTGIEKKAGDARYLIDSCGWIEYFKGGKNTEEFAKYIEQDDKVEIIVPTIVLYEVYKRFLIDFDSSKATRYIAHMNDHSKVCILDDTIALLAGDLSVTEKLPMADAIIYSTALTLDAIVVTSDEDFRDKKNVIFIS